MIYYNEAKCTTQTQSNLDLDKSTGVLNLENSGFNGFSQFEDNEKTTGSILKNDFNFHDTSLQPIIFTMAFNLKTFQIIKNHFVSIFKVTYPDQFFTDVYNKKYQDGCLDRPRIIL